jgi:hypothetical protein
MVLHLLKSKVDIFINGMALYLMPSEVRMITATWCKRCHTIKPDVVEACRFAGANLVFIDFDEIEEDNPLKGVKSLPTMQILIDKEWKSFSANEYSDWNALLMSQAVISPANDDF